MNIYTPAKRHFQPPPDKRGLGGSLQAMQDLTVRPEPVFRQALLPLLRRRGSAVNLPHPPTSLSKKLIIECPLRLLTRISHQATHRQLKRFPRQQTIERMTISSPLHSALAHPRWPQEKYSRRRHEHIPSVHRQAMSSVASACLQRDTLPRACAIIALLGEICGLILYQLGKINLRFYRRYDNYRFVFFF